MLAKLPDTNGHVVEGDKIQPYFLITTAHNGTQALLAKSTPIRVVCQNTLDAALRGDRAAVSIRHTASGPSRIAEIDKFVEQMLGAHHRTVDTFKKMAETYVTVPDVIKYSEVLFPRLKDANGKEPQSQFARTGELKVSRNDEAREVITQLFHYGKGAQLAPSSAWTAYNAVTEYVDHVSVLRKDGKLRSGGAQSAIFGLGADTKRRALDVALEMFVNIPVAA
jgi:phage/plasmid-like protein (TIGR03299 family)